MSFVFQGLAERSSASQKDTHRPVNKVAAQQKISRFLSRIQMKHRGNVAFHKFDVMQTLSKLSPI